VTVRDRLDADREPVAEPTPPAARLDAAGLRAARARCEPQPDDELLGQRIAADELGIADGAEADRADETEGALGAVPDYPLDVLAPCARELVVYGEGAGLPRALVAGAVLGALAAAIGPGAQIEVTGAWHERAILWVPLLASRGAGKTPSQDLAFRPLREHDARLQDGGTEILLGDQTLEALARSLHESEGGGALDLDELSAQLRGIGEYKRGGGGDRGRFLALWSGAPWSYTRAGAGGNRTNAVKLRCPRPTLVICGGLQIALHELLGDEESGMRPRWLPHIGMMPEDDGTLRRAGAPAGWRELISGALIPARGTERTWRLDNHALATLQRYRSTWKAQSRQVETATTCAALVKADIHLARVALVLAEAQAPAEGGEIGADLIDRAAAVIDFTLDCWRALPEQGALALSYRDETLDRGIPRLVSWLDEHGGRATRRELQRARVAGVRTARDLNLLLLRYEATYPGTVRDTEPEHGGLAIRTVSSPLRRPVSPHTQPHGRGAKNASNNGDSHAVTTGDNVAGDTDLVTPTTETPEPRSTNHIRPLPTLGDTDKPHYHDTALDALDDAVDALPATRRGRGAA
jgi:Protein of unknown function (DUF3987)